MKWLRCGVTIAAFLLTVVSASAGPTFTLVKDGKPACSIIIAEKPSDNARIGAKELQTYIEKISGAKLEIRTDAEKIDGAKILVGRSRLTDAMSDLNIPSGITPAFCEEGYVVRCKGDTLALAGNDTEIGDKAGDKVRVTNGSVATIGNAMYLGTRYAVCDLLNRLGVRWYMPGDYGEVVPKSATLQVPELSVTEHPGFPVRSFFACGGDGQASTDARELWMVRNRMNPRSEFWFGLPGDSSIVGMMPRDKVKEHPEWFALQPDGTRLAGMPCMSDELRRGDPQYAGQPRLLDAFMERIGEDADNGRRVTAFSPDDGTPTCECDLCKRVSSRFTIGEDPATGYITSQEYFFFVNGLLDSMGQKYPGHVIATNGYANRCAPPEVGPEFNKYKNLTIMFADITGCTIHRFDDPKCAQNQQQWNFLKRWSRLSDKVWCYNYNYTMLVTKGTLTPMEKRIATNIPLVKEAGSIGFCDQDWMDIMQLGIPTYVARFALEWNPKVNLQTVLNDFYSKWYGPAAAPMRDYYETLENAFDKATCHGHEDIILPLVYTPNVMARLADDMGKAEAAVGSLPPYQGGGRGGVPDQLHVHVERLLFDHLRLYVDSVEAKQECHYAQAASMMRRMLALKKEMRKISNHMGWEQEPYSMSWEAQRMDRLAKMTMLTPLPQTARFRFDKQDGGRSQRWMEPEYNDRKWQMANVTSGWQDQGLKDDDGLPSTTRDGHPFKGMGWYRFTLDVPAVPKAKEAHLFCPAVTNQVWTWVNGQYVGRNEFQSGFGRPHELDVDITHYLKPGKNVIALRVHGMQEYFGANGIYERPFLYTK